jgi:hypothetical protein
MTTQKKPYITPKVEKLEFAATEEILTSGFDDSIFDPVDDDQGSSGGDKGRGRGHGGGCDHIPEHSNARTFSNGRNSNC